MKASPVPVYALDVKGAIASLATEAHGLTGSEAARRLTEYGPNELVSAARISPWTILFEQFKNVLVIILLIATALSAALGHGGSIHRPAVITKISGVMKESDVESARGKASLKLAADRC